MFDLKKRNSLTLKSGREAEEFRRVAVRRRVVSGVVDCPASDVSGVFGSYSCDPAGEKINEIKCNYYVKSPAKRSPLKPQVPPKPAYLQSPPRDGGDQACSPTNGKIPPQAINVTTDQDHNPKGASVSCLSPTQSSPSPIRGRRSHFLRRKHTSPSGSNLSCSHALGSPSPGKRGIESRSPLREGGHSPAKLSPRNPSTLMGKLRTPSPIQRMKNHNPSKSSMSWLGLHRIPNERTERQEKSAGKSLSVPDLIVHMDESRSSTERSPLKALQTPNNAGSAVKTRHRASLPFLSSSNEHAMKDTIQSAEWPVININGVEGKTPTRQGSRCSCKWTNITSGNEQSHEEPGGEQTEEKEEEKEEEEREEVKEPKDVENTELKVYKIANELLQTERAYVARLHLLDQVFFSRLTEEAGRGSFPPDMIRNIFSNISSIYSFHSQFLLPDLEKCLSHWGEGPGLGEVLLQHAPFLRMYADYVKNFDQAMELVRTWTERSSSFRNIIQDIQSQEVCGSLTLQHHMLEPVQRVPRYEMLLKDYLKKLPEDNPDYDLSQKSLQSISMAATHSNSAIHKAECLKRLLEIYEMVGEEEVVNPTNEFLKEGRLLKLAARNASAMERHLFLFNNFLLCCSPKFSLVGQRLAVRCRIGMEGLQVMETTNEDHPFTFQVSGKEKTLELQASSEQDKDDWIKVIQEAIDVFEKKNETFKLASKEVDVDEQTEELGRRAPRWIRDNEVTMCMTCWEPFNALTRRRHHCRACGFVVCWRCSDYKVPLEYDGNKLNKVCKSCYPILMMPRGEGEDGKKRRTLESGGSPDVNNCVINGFLLYGDDPLTWQRLWASIIQSDPPVLQLYHDPKEVKPVYSISLLACSIQTSPEGLQSQPCFHLKELNTSHIFSCDSPDLTKSWLTAIEDVVKDRMPVRSPSVCDITRSKPDFDGSVHNELDKKCAIGRNNGNHSCI